MTECAQCGESVDNGTQKCPNCEYRPQTKMQLVGMVGFVAGLLISATLIGAIVGIPMMLWAGYARVWRGRDLTVESEYAT